MIAYTYEDCINIVKRVKRFKELSGVSEVESVLKLNYSLKEYFEIRSVVENLQKHTDKEKLL